MFIFFALSGAASPVTAQDDLIVRQLKFEGNESIERATLEAAIATTKSSWFATAPIIRAIGLGEKRRLNQRDLERDVERLELLYRIYGFMEVSVDTTVRRTAEDVFITFHIEEGEPVILTRFDIFGIDSVAEPERITRDLPLRVGEPFNRYLLQASGDTMTARLRDSGYPEGRVFLETRQVDSARRVAEIEVRIQPGDRKVIGDVRVEGFRPGDSAFVIDLMAARRGDLYRRSELIRSQRNIVATESYRFAAVVPAGVGVAIVQPTGGTGNPLVSAVLAVLGDEQFTEIVMPYRDGTNLTALEADLLDRWGPMRPADGHAYACADDTFGNLSTFGNGRNSPFVTTLGVKNVPTPAYEIAAVLAATVASEAQRDPARPFTNLPLVGVLAPAVADRFSQLERNTLLFDGISTSVVVAGSLCIDRLITMYQLNGAGSPDESYLDLNTMLTLSYLRYSLRLRLGSRFDRAKLARDGTRFGPGQVVITPKVAKAEIVALFDEWEAAGLVEDVDQFVEDLIVEINSTDPNRLDVLLPPNLINQLLVTAVKIQFIR